MTLIGKCRELRVFLRKILAPNDRATAADRSLLSSWPSLGFLLAEKKNLANFPTH